MSLGNINFFKFHTENTAAQNNVESGKGTADSVKLNTGSSQALGVEILKSMTAGQTFQGEVLSVQGNQVLLRLQGGAQLGAVLSGDIPIEAGKNVTFVVQDTSQSTIAIKPLAADGQEMMMADKALESASLAFTEKNYEMVRELVRQNLPINKQTLNETVRLVNKFPETDMRTLVQMNRLHLPVTEENIAQFKAYQSYESSIFNDLKSMESQLPQLLAGQETLPKAQEMLSRLTQALYEAPPPETDLNATPQAPKDYLEPQQHQQLTADIKENFPPQLAAPMLEVLEHPQGTTQQFLTAFKEALKTALQAPGHPENEALAKAGKNLFESEGLRRILGEALNENLTYPLEKGMDKENVRKFFEKSSTLLKNLQEALGKESAAAQQLAKNAENIRQNIDFMNDINKNMAYFQMPIRFSEGQGNGELYVFADKRKLAAKSDNLSAMLHLDMEHLGAVDVFVRLSGKNVSTDFSLESEEMLDFVYSRMEFLTARLERLGYTAHFEMKLKENDERLDFAEDFLDSGAKPVEISQYLFDMKA